MCYPDSMIKRAILIVTCLLASIVSASAEPVTAKYETLITNATKTEVLDALKNGMKLWNFELLKQQDDMLVFGKKGASITSALPKGTTSTPEWRFTYYVLENPGDIKITVNIAAVINPGHAFEKWGDVNKESCTVQNAWEFLENIRKGFEVRKALKDRGKIGVQLNKDEIINVIPDSPAEKAGILKGDIILKVDGVDMTGDLLKDTLRISGKPGSTAHLLIKRGKRKLMIPVIRGNP